MISGIRRTQPTYIFSLSHTKPICKSLRKCCQTRYNFQDQERSPSFLLCSTVVHMFCTRTKCVKSLDLGRITLREARINFISKKEERKKSGNGLTEDFVKVLVIDGLSEHGWSSQTGMWQWGMYKWQAHFPCVNGFASLAFSTFPWLNFTGVAYCKCLCGYVVILWHSSANIYFLLTFCKLLGKPHKFP